MKKNIGNADRIIRIIIGLLILSLFIFLEGNAKYFGLIGLIPLVTAFVRFCPLYKIVGIDSSEKKS